MVTLIRGLLLYLFLVISIVISVSASPTLGKRDKLLGTNALLHCLPPELPSLNGHGLDIRTRHIIRQFKSRTALCGIEGLGGLPYDVGCTCPQTPQPITPGFTSPQTSPFRNRHPKCLLGLRTVSTSQDASQRLIANSIYRAFAPMCRSNCVCFPPPEEGGSEMESAESSTTDIDLIGYSGSSRPSSAGTSYGTSEGSYFGTFDYDLGLCGAPCTSRRECLAKIPKGEEGCGECRIDQGQPLGQSVVMGVSNVIFKAASCALAGTAVLKHRRPPLGGRDVGTESADEILCPCNSTYVSSACCDSKDGLVWESQSLKRGILGDSLDE